MRWGPPSAPAEVAGTVAQVLLPFLAANPAAPAMAMSAPGGPPAA